MTGRFRTLVPVTAVAPGAAPIADTPRVGLVSAPLAGPDEAAGLLHRRRVVALTGAGLSTDSGIPDYRGPDSPPRTPMTYGEFVSGPVAQQRYWARSHLGWQRMHQARPNPGHLAVADLQQAGVIGTVITQNVDGLHGEAGSPAVIDLHGRIDRVVCLSCADVSARSALHRRLSEMNPGYGSGAAVATAPDGDVDFADTADFVVAPCLRCSGPLKPDVVFFGENVPRERVEIAYRAVDSAQALLVAGSSLTVMSGLRFVRHAARRGMTIVIVNRGVTRGDPLAAYRVDAGCSQTLQAFRAILS